MTKKSAYKKPQQPKSRTNNKTTGTTGPSLYVTVWYENQRDKIQGPDRKHFEKIEQAFGVDLAIKGKKITVDGKNAARAQKVVKKLASQAKKGSKIDMEDVENTIDLYQHHANQNRAIHQNIDTPLRVISPRTPLQAEFIRATRQHDLSFGIGPAGSGKTYLAVAMATEALNKGDVSRIILSRPAVEAGERLGFLPGDLSQKMDPYLRPLYDAMYEFLGAKKTTELIEKNVIEIAPLAYLRGRNINNAFMILDEGQNTTTEQMKMFLTRIGEDSKAVVTGDITQNDLPKGQLSGLQDAWNKLGNEADVNFTKFGTADVTRSRIVQTVVAAYDRAEKEQSQSSPAVNAPAAG